MDGVRMGLRSKGKEMDGVKKDHKIRKHAINVNLQKYLMKSDKEVVKNSMMISFLTSPEYKKNLNLNLNIISKGRR
jgi:hypothetical protein